MQTYRIAVYPGDGIGVDVTAQAVRVLKACQSQLGAFKLELNDIPWGVKYWQETGEIAPANLLEVLQPMDAILLGAVGWPALIPDHVTLWPLVTIRQRFDQYACMRPAQLLPGVPCVLAGKGPKEVDMVVIRENSEGEYVGAGGRMRKGTPAEVAIQTAIHTRSGVERILRYGFDIAMRRRKKLTMVTKSNALGHAYVMWDEILEEIAPEFPEVKYDRQHADAAVMNMVRMPEYFDVIVASNLFGDILTDLGGLLGGGLGLAPSTNCNPERKFPSMFEPVHGSAPDIAGKGIANPIASILSAAMMLDHLNQTAAGDRIRAAVGAALVAGAKTPDLGGKLTTSGMGDAILQAMEKLPR